MADRDDNNQDWEIGVSTCSSSSPSSSSSKKGSPDCRPPPFPDSYIDVEEEKEYAEEYHDDDVDVDDDDDDDDDHDEGDCSDKKLGLACPFCSEDFDVLELYCHIDVVHHKEARLQICPVCDTRVETSMAVHLITQHETILKILSKKKFRTVRSYPTISPLKKELGDEDFHSSPKGSNVSSSPAVEPDFLLLPFLYNPQPSGREMVRPITEARSLGSNSPDSILESSGDVINYSVLPDKDEVKARRCEFIGGLLVSTIFGDQL